MLCLIPFFVFQLLCQVSRTLACYSGAALRKSSFLNSAKMSLILAQARSPLLTTRIKEHETKMKQVYDDFIEIQPLQNHLDRWTLLQLALILNCMLIYDRLQQMLASQICIPLQIASVESSGKLYDAFTTTKVLYLKLIDMSNAKSKTYNTVAS